MDLEVTAALKLRTVCNQGQLSSESLAGKFVVANERLQPVDVAVVGLRLAIADSIGRAMLIS